MTFLSCGYGICVEGGGGEEEEGEGEGEDGGCMRLEGVDERHIFIIYMHICTHLPVYSVND